MSFSLLAGLLALGCVSETGSGPDSEEDYLTFRFVELPEVMQGDYAGHELTLVDDNQVAICMGDSVDETGAIALFDRTTGQFAVIQQGLICIDTTMVDGTLHAIVDTPVADDVPERSLMRFNGSDFEPARLLNPISDGTRMLGFAKSEGGAPVVGLEAADGTGAQLSYQSEEWELLDVGPVWEEGWENAPCDTVDVWATGETCWKAGTKAGDRDGYYLAAGTGCDGDRGSDDWNVSYYDGSSLTALLAPCGGDEPYCSASDLVVADEQLLVLTKRDWVASLAIADL